MALIKCPECGKEISSSASQCPNCGCPIREERYEAITNVSNNLVQCEKCGTWNPVGSYKCKTCQKIITGLDYTYTNKKAGGINTAPQKVTKTKTPFYQSTWFVILMLLCWCFPIGLFLMWKYKKFNKNMRIIITALYAITFFGIIASPSKGGNGETTISVENSSNQGADTAELDLESESESSHTVSETTEEETSEPVLSEEEFKSECQQIGYKVLLRNPSDYVGSKIVITAKVQQIMQGGWFDKGQYYRIQTDASGYDLYLDDEYFMYDKRASNSMKILQDDVIKIYAEFIGTETITRALTGTKEEIPAINAYYIDLISE